MATKKPKATKTASKSAKPKTAAKTVEKPVSEAPKSNPAKADAKTSKCSCFKGFFAKKYEEDESILTVFKKPKFYGALVGEILGTALITMLIMCQIHYGIATFGQFAGIAAIGIYVALYAFSGACLNPIVTIGMMATRRMSVIRGIMYIIAEIIGAWLGWIILNAFYQEGGGLGELALPVMTTITDKIFWPVAMLELFGGVIIAFFFARALKFKRSAFTFGAVVASGIILSYIIAFIVSAGYNNIHGNFVMNPATALMLQIFPTSGENFGAIMSGIGQALTIYALFPAIGGVCGFYLSDFASKLSGEE